MDHAQALRHFQAHHSAQLKRLSTLASHPQPLFFQLLPLLFHINHKLLPGYVGEDCPAGIIDYRPAPQTLTAASSLSRNFNYRRKALRRYAIRGLYLLNPAGLLAYPSRPRFTVWLIFNERLSAQQVRVLQSKFIALRDWAQTLGVQMEGQCFRENEIRNATKIQSKLDEFYSQGLVLAGSVPLWWLLSLKENAQYAAHTDRLIAQRNLTQTSFLDFGLAGSANAKALFDAAYQAWMDELKGQVSAPLQTLFQLQQLKLFPQPVLLSELYKKAILQGEPEALFMDLNVLKLRALEQHASATEIATARQALYQLSHEKLSRKVTHPAHPWRRLFIQQCVTQWQWSTQQLIEQDETEIQQCRHRLQNQASSLKIFEQKLQKLQIFARQHELNVSSDLDFAKRLLSLQRRPAEDVVAVLPTAQRLKNGFEQLFLQRFADTGRWFISEIFLTSAKQSALYQDASVVKVLLFAIQNGLMNRATWIKVTDQQQQINPNVIIDLSRILLNTPKTEQAESIDSKTLNHEAHARKILLFINLKPRHHDKLQQLGLQLSSLQNDPLSYSSARLNLIENIDLLIFSSWGQWHHVHFQQPTALIDGLALLLRWQPKPSSGQSVLCWCPTAIFGQSISHRLSQIVTRLIQHQQQFPREGQYFIQIGLTVWQLSWQMGQVEQRLLPASVSAIDELAKPDKAFSPALLDLSLDPSGLINHLLGYQQRGEITVFVTSELTSSSIRLWLLDTQGQLSQMEFAAASAFKFGPQLKAFLQHSLPQIPVNCFHLSLQNRQWQTEIIDARHSPRGLNAHYDPLKKQLELTFPEGSLSIQLDDVKFEAGLKKRLLSQFKSADEVQLDSLQFDDGHHVPLKAYLQLKKQLENYLKRMLN